MKLPLLGQTGSERYGDASNQYTLNWYPHLSDEAKSKIMLYPTPGTSVLKTIRSDGVVRGMIVYGSKLYAVIFNKFYRIESNGATIELGTLNTSSGLVSMAHNGSDNGKQIIIVDGTNGYIYDSGLDAFTQIKEHATGTAEAGTTGTTLVDTGVFTSDMVGQIVYNTTDGTSTTISAYTDANTVTIESAIFAVGETFTVGDDDFPDGATHAVFMDGFFIVNDPANSGRFYLSNAYDGTVWEALRFATAERSPDTLQGIVASDRMLILVGERSCETWFNAGTPNVPFAPMQGGFNQFGTIAPKSIIDINGAALWLSQTKDGVGPVVMSVGGQIKPVSTEGIDAEIRALTQNRLNEAYAFSYQYAGHTFYVLTFPTDSVTLVYDLNTNLWHNWGSHETGNYIGNCHAYVYGKHFVGSSIRPEILELDWDTYTDAGQMISRIRRSVPIHNSEGTRKLRHYAVGLDVKEGVGNSDIADPKIHLRWRDRNGAWSNYHTRSLGKIGETGKKVIWRMLGKSDDRTYEISSSDPAPIVLIDGYANIEDSQDELG